MIDHVSIGVRSLEDAAGFYSVVLAALGYAKMVERADTIGFGLKYPCLWLNRRRDMATGDNSGWHVALRARTLEQVDGFHRAALEHGGVCAGPPGWRHYSRADCYAAFIKDTDGNRLEAVHFGVTASGA